MPGRLLLQERVIYFLRFLITAAAYFVLARVSLFLSFQTSNATPIWPPSGFAFALILLYGYRITPAILIGAFAANLAVFELDHDADLSTALWVSLIISIGNTVEAITGYYLLKKIIPAVKDTDYFRKVNHIFYFSLVTFVMSLASSIAGTAAIVLGKFIGSGQQYIAWLTWWMGDVSGILLFTPFILIWLNVFRSQDKPAFHRKKVIETGALFLFLVLTSGIIFNNWFFTLFIFKWAFWIIPVIVWAATRLNQQESVTATVLCAVIAIWGTLHGHGPFAIPSPGAPSDISLNQSLLITQAFVSIIVITILTLNASVIAQKQTEEALRDMGNQLEKRVNERTAELGERNLEIMTASEKLKQSEEQARLSEIKFKGLLENAPDAMVIVNKDGIIELVNAQTETLFGFENDELIGKKVEMLIPGRFHQVHSKHRENYFENPKFRSMGVGLNLSGRKKDGSEFPLEISLSPLETAEGILISASIRDVTERKKAEEEIKQMAEELIHYNKQLEQTNKELESFTYIASHDLQEPLRKIRTFLNLIAEREMDTLSDVSRNYLNRTINSAQQMQQLIIDLLAYSRTTASEEHFKKTDMNAILQKVKYDLKEVVEEKKAVIEANGLPELNVIPFQLEQLFANLIGNSLKFSKTGVAPQIFIRFEIVDGKTIGINGDTEERYYSFSISDNGIGFETKYNEKVFDLFQRLHSRNEYSGTGIGLSICKKIIENHKGFITARGEPGIGATFTIYLPK